MVILKNTIWVACFSAVIILPTARADEDNSQNTDTPGRLYITNKVRETVEVKTDKYPNSTNRPDHRSFGYPIKPKDQPFKDTNFHYRPEKIFVREVFILHSDPPKLFCTLQYSAGPGPTSGIRHNKSNE